MGEGDGKRIELIRTPGIDTRYVWDGENIQNETNLAGLNRDVFTYDPAGYGRLLSVLVPTEKFLRGMKPEPREGENPRLEEP